jgi:HSP20 family molecular chaperone IbpA
MSQPLQAKGLGTMSRMTLLDHELWLGGGLSRSFLFGKSPEAGYPPYNIELVGAGESANDVLRITLAVAGFALEDLSITVEDAQLVVRGQQSEEREREFLYRGIAARRFKRSFGLANGVEVKEAQLHNGLLTIELIRPLPLRKARTVPIASREAPSAGKRGLSGRRATVADAEES